MTAVPQNERLQFWLCYWNLRNLIAAVLLKGWLRRTTLALVSTFTSPSTTGDLEIQYTSMNKWRYKLILFGCGCLFLLVTCLFDFMFYSSFLSFFPPSMQLEKRSLPMEEACHITMEVVQPQHISVLNLKGSQFVVKVHLSLECKHTHTHTLCVQNVFPPLRWIALTPLFVHFSSGQMKRERGSASPGPIRANRNGCLIYIAIRLCCFHTSLKAINHTCQKQYAVNQLRY